MKKTLPLLPLIFSFLALVGCGGGGGGDNANTNTPTFTISGSVTGLNGSGLVLQNNGADNLAISANGAISFATALNDGGSYTITVQNQPTSPAQTCTVSNGSGTLAGANITNLTINCVDNPPGTYFTISGSVSGLNGSGLVLQNNGGDNLAISASGVFSFATALIDGATYLVTTQSQPTGPAQTCTVSNGSGTLAGANITNVAVSCVDDPIATFTISGSVSGLNGSGLVLQNNGGDNMAISANSGFTFATALIEGASYTVTVQTQPTSPAQTCTVSNGSGTLAGANITNVAVSCVNNPPSGTFTISGSVSGLNGSGLILQNNGTDNRAISVNGAFSFATALNDGELYTITAQSQPTGPAQHCIIANAYGKLASANISDVQVSCVNIIATRAGIIESNLFAGTKNLEIAVGDVNGDGKPDVVTANNGQVNEVWFNDDDRFVNSGQALNSSGNPDIPSQTFSIALGDIDGDGDLDIISGDTSFHSIWINDNTGFFTNAGQDFLIAGGWDLGVGDIDNDGDLDFVSVGFGANQVFTNNPIDIISGNPIGNGVFSGTQSLGTSDSVAVVLADVDGDTDLDMVVGNTNGQPNIIWINDGTGAFTDSGQTLGTGETSSVAVADIDGDGDLDIVFGNGDNVTNEANTVWTNNGSGVFTDTTQVLGTEATYSVALGDIDGDGDADLVVGNTNEPNTAWTNDGSGVFTNTGQTLGKAYTWSNVLHDMDADGDLDIVAGNDEQQPNVVYHNNGDGVFTDSTQASAIDGSATSITLGDIDDDGDLDMVVTDQWQTGFVRLNDGNGSYTDTQSLTYSDTTSAAFGDVDNDGDLDLVVGRIDSFGNVARSNNVYFNNGTGTLVDTGQALAGGVTESVALGDIDNDGDLDLIAGNDGANKIWLNNGNGTFSDSGQSLGAYWTMNIVLADIDNDNDLDIIAANISFNTLVWLNDGNGVFTDSGQALSSAWSIALGDVDGDNDLDLVQARSGSNRVWTNTGGVFTDSGQLLADAGGFSTSVALGDMDGDGDLDMVVGNDGVGGLTPIPNTVWINDGSGTFVDSTQTLGSDGTTTLTLGDIDGDSDLDIVVGNGRGNYQQANRIYRNLTYTK